MGKVITSEIGLASNFFEMLNLLDNLEFVTLKDKEKCILYALENTEFNMISRHHLIKQTKIADRTLRRLLHKMENLGLISCFRSNIKFIYLSPILADILTFTGHCDHDFEVMRRNISQNLLQSYGYNKQDQDWSLHSQNSFESEHEEKLGQSKFQFG